MTAKDHLATIKGLLKQYSKPQISQSDSFVYGLIVKVSGWYQARSLERGGQISSFNLRQFPVRLQEDTNHGYSCFPGCKVMASNFYIPKPLSIKSRDIIRVSTLDGREMHMITPAERPSKMLDEYLQTQYMCSIINKRLVVYSKTKPTVVLVSGLFMDLSEWMELPACDDEGEYTGDTCIDPRNYDIPLDEDNQIPMYNEVLRLLGMSISIPVDSTNNANNQS